ncbi:unnamed protein product [Allacma fusca]|uniref:Uncharacterized protein n=1 Tax=Allacma fusca TaxID=39272 RepID=A0A8J2JFJ2_9HEXA|nr:unnamed protein product [Allacma fusca]
MKSGNFNLRKWSSNNPKVLEVIPENLRETKLPLKVDLDETANTLGLRLHPALDHFTFTVQPFGGEVFTKRTVLADISKILDSLGIGHCQLMVT